MQIYEAQNVLSQVRGKTIILKLPKIFKDFDTQINYKGCAFCQLCCEMIQNDSRNRIKVLLQKMRNSISHVNKFNVQVKIEYI